MKTIFNTLRPVFSEKVKNIFKDRHSYKELLTAIEAEREGDEAGTVIHLKGLKLKLVRVS